MIRAEGEGAAVSDDLVGCLAKAVAATGRPPKIVTLSATPVTNLMAHVFGAAAAQAVIVRASDAAGEVSGHPRGDGGPALPSGADPAVFATIPRFLDSETFDRVHQLRRPWLIRAAAILLQFQPGERQIKALAADGFTRALRFAAVGRGATLFLAPGGRATPARDSAAIAGRSAPARLVIVDPCLGRAAGHYEAYARMLTDGAFDHGLSVVWACHAALDAALVPAGVEVRRCFRRCFFDLDGEQGAAVDLSPELAGGWASLLTEFDSADTHFLMHSADAHQLRAVAAVFETRPAPRAVVHINFQASPRFMPGRLAGSDVHAAILRLRTAPAWERSLFFWAETRRLAAWLSDWLGEDIPTPPFLSGWRAATPPIKRPGDPITLAFLGEGRPSKGFLDLPDIADRIAAQSPPTRAIRLAVQDWPPFRGDLDSHEAVIARLSRHPFVEIVNGVLDPPAYEALLDRADILLLPYLAQNYGLQGSGVLVEGLARGKIIIARAGTAIADEARAGVGFSFRTPEDLAEGLAAIIDDHAPLAATAGRLADQFRVRNNPRRFVSALASRARGRIW